MADVFISYASASRPKADVLRRWFEDAGWSVWWDREIEIGAGWEHVLPRELDAARAVVVLWCPKSRWSKWVIAEAEHALKAGKLVQVRATGLAIPPPFSTLQWVRFEAWDGEAWHGEAARLLHAVAERLGVEPPAPTPPAAAGSTPVDRLEAAQIALWFCAVRAEFYRRNACGAQMPEPLLDDLRATYDELKKVLEPIDDTTLHELVAPFLDVLEDALPSKVPQGELENQAVNPFSEA